MLTFDIAEPVRDCREERGSFMEATLPARACTTYARQNPIRAVRTHRSKPLAFGTPVTANDDERTGYGLAGLVVVALVCCAAFLAAPFRREKQSATASGEWTDAWQ
jgi:hypothetical protein